MSGYVCQFGPNYCMIWRLSQNSNGISVWRLSGQGSTRFLRTRVRHRPAVGAGDGDDDIRHQLPDALSRVPRFATPGQDIDDSYPDDLFENDA